MLQHLQCNSVQHTQQLSYNIFIICTIQYFLCELSKLNFSALVGGGSVHKRPALVSAQHGEKAITGTVTKVTLVLFLLFTNQELRPKNV